MKRLTILLCLIIAALQTFPQSVDSLKARREQLYAKYSLLNMPGKKLKKDDIKQSLTLLKELVITDTKIISAYASSDTVANAARLHAQVLESKNADLSSNLQADSDHQFILYLVIGLLTCLTVVMLVLLGAYIIRHQRLVKKLANYNEVLLANEMNISLLVKLNEAKAAKEKELIEKDSALLALQKEMKEAETMMDQMQEKIHELQSQPPPPPMEQNTTEESADPNMAKLEKLGRMKDLGVVTEDEFNTFKKKILGEL